MPPPFRYILFDLDNTLIDRVAGVRYLGKTLYESDVLDQTKHSIENAVEIFERIDADGYQPDKLKLFTDLANEWGPMKRTPHELVDWYMSAPRDWFEPDPAVTDFLNYLNDSSVAWGIVTNGDAVQTEKARLCLVNEGAKCIVVSKVFGVSKPDPSIFHEALKHLGNPSPEEVLFVGDNPTADVVGAANIGMQTAWIIRNRDWPTELPEPNYSFDSVTEVRGLVDRH
jgi:putative hydrolase of the HAD superfamily